MKTVGLALAVPVLAAGVVVLGWAVAVCVIAPGAKR